MSVRMILCKENKIDCLIILKDKDTHEIIDKYNSNNLEFNIVDILYLETTDKTYKICNIRVEVEPTIYTFYVKEILNNV